MLVLARGRVEHGPQLGLVGRGVRGLTGLAQHRPLAALGFWGQAVDVLLIAQAPVLVLALAAQHQAEQQRDCDEQDDEADHPVTDGFGVVEPGLVVGQIRQVLGDGLGVGPVHLGHHLVAGLEALVVQGAVGDGVGLDGQLRLRGRPVGLAGLKDGAVAGFVADGQFAGLGQADTVGLEALGDMLIDLGVRRDLIRRVAGFDPDLVGGDGRRFFRHGGNRCGADQTGRGQKDELFHRFVSLCLSGNNSPGMGIL